MLSPHQISRLFSHFYFVLTWKQLFFKLSSRAFLCEFARNELVILPRPLWCHSLRSLLHSGNKFPSFRSSLREWHTMQRSSNASFLGVTWLGSSRTTSGPLLARGTSPLDGKLRLLWRSVGHSSQPHRLRWRQTLVPRALASYVDPFGTASQVLRTQVWRERWWSFLPPSFMWRSISRSDRRGFVPQPLLSISRCHRLYYFVLFVHVGLRPSRLRLNSS